MAEQNGEEPDINLLSGDMEAMLDEFGMQGDDASGGVVDIYSDDTDIGFQENEPSTKEFLVMLYSQSPSDSIRNHFGRSYQAAHDAIESGRTKLFYCLELVVPLLYWYNAFHRIMTDKVQLVCPCYLESRIVVVSLWRTRCNSPVAHAITFDVKSESCSIQRCSYQVSC